MTTVRKFAGILYLEELIHEMQTLDEGAYTVYLRPFKHRRSEQQNDYLWGVVYPLILDSFLDHGIEITNIEDVHAFFKAKFSGKEAVDYNTGEVIFMPDSTRKMDTVIFNVFVRLICEYALEYLNLEIPPPHDKKRNREKRETTEIQKHDR